MSQPKTLNGIDHHGNPVALAATVSHPDKNVIRFDWADGYDAAVFRLADATLIAVGNGDDSWMVKVELKPGEEITSISRNEAERFITVVTHGG